MVIKIGVVARSSRRMRRICSGFLMRIVTLIARRLCGLVPRIFRPSLFVPFSLTWQMGLLSTVAFFFGQDAWASAMFPSHHVNSFSWKRIPHATMSHYLTYGLQVLPTATGGSITWINDFNPTSTSRPPGTPGTATPTASQAAPEPSRGLSTGAKAGIGVGVSLAALFILGLLLWCCLTRRRRSRDLPKLSNPPEQAQIAIHAPYPPTYHSGNYSNAHSPIPATATASPIGYEQQWQHSTLPKSYLVVGPGHDAFTGFKNELPADEIRPSEIASPSINPVTPTSPVEHDILRARSDASDGRMSHDQRQDYVAGGYYLSPQSTGSENNYAEGRGHGHQEAPSEMQG